MQSKPNIMVLGCGNGTESVNDLYMNTNTTSRGGHESIKQIRSVRAKNQQLSSNNSSN